MKKQTIRASTRALIALLSVSSLLSFVVGVSVAGGFTATRVAAPRALLPEAPAAAGVSALYGSHAATPAALPIAGKGMWIWQFDKIAHGNPGRIVQAALAHGLTHIYVRSGSSHVGLKGWSDVAKILPVAHAHGLKVIAWDFPYLRNPGADVRRARWVLNQTVQGHSVDGFAADVETRSEGTVLTRTRARNYAHWLRANSRGKFIVLVPPRPNPYTVSFYPYDLLVPSFDAVAPMIYWGSRSPDGTARWAIDYLKRFGKPVAPIGQSFDMGPEGGPKGAPKGSAVRLFMDAARTRGAVGVSFWSWQHTPARLWHTINTYTWKTPPGHT